MPVTYCDRCGDTTYTLLTDTGEAVEMDIGTGDDGTVILKPIPDHRWTRHVAHVLADDETPEPGVPRHRLHRCKAWRVDRGA